MPLAARHKSRLSSALLKRYAAIAAILTFLVWAAFVLSTYPLKDSDGSYASYPYGLTTGLEDKSLNQLFQLGNVFSSSLGRRGSDEPITIIEIDEASIRASGVRLQRWRRDWYARLIDRASEGGAGVIGLDIILSETSGTSAEESEYDQQLAESIEKAGNVVVGRMLPVSGSEAIEPQKIYRDAAYDIGFFNVPLDRDGFVRATQLVVARPGEDDQPSFATVIAQGYLASIGNPSELSPKGANHVELGGRVTPLRTDGLMQLDIRGRTPAFRRISAGDILFQENPQIASDLFLNKIVLIGASNLDAPDLFNTPFFEPSALTRLFDPKQPNNPARTPGVEIHANSVATLLFGRALDRPGFFSRAIILLIPLVLAAFALFKFRAVFALASVIAVAAFALVIGVAAFTLSGYILPLASVWLSIASLTPVGLGLRYAHERALYNHAEAERAQLMDIFSGCVSEEVAEELWERRDTILTGERRVVSLIFTDIRGFTTVVESAVLDHIVVWLNDYFSRMQKIVESHGGYINKFIGDGLMIVFGAPASRGDEIEARAAVACGLEMLAEVERMNEEWEGTGRPHIAIGVGIHTGEAICGVIGSVKRMEYTIIGDAVNLSARLESTTKEYGVPMLISAATARLLDNQYETRPLGEVRVKGKRVSTTIYAIGGMPALVEEPVELSATG